MLFIAPSLLCSIALALLRDKLVYLLSANGVVIHDYSYSSDDCGVGLRVCACACACPSFMEINYRYSEASHSLIPEFSASTPIPVPVLEEESPICSASAIQTVEYYTELWSFIALF